MKRKAVIVFLILGLLLASSITLTLTFAQSSDSEQTQDKHRLRTENLIKIAFSAMNKANQTINFASTHQINQSVIDEATSNYTAGEEWLTLANATLYGEPPAPEETWGNHTIARRLALKAMHQFRAAIAKIMGQWEETGLAAGWRGLSGAIQRAEDFVAMVTALVEKAKENYPNYDFTIIDEKLNESSQHLAWARANMTELKINVTARELGRARQSLNRITTEVKRIGHSIPVQGRRIGQFIGKPLKKLIQNIEDFAKKTGKNVTAQISVVQSKINEAKTLAESGDLRGAMVAIREAHRMLRDLAKELHEK